MSDTPVRVTLVIAEAMLEAAGSVVGEGAVPPHALWLHPASPGRYAVSSYDLPGSAIDRLRDHPLLQVAEQTADMPPAGLILMLLDPDPITALVRLGLTCPMPM